MSNTTTRTATHPPAATSPSATRSPLQGLPDPPPYTPPIHTVFGNVDEDEDEESSPTTTFNVHVPTTIQGCGNIIALPPPDVTRIATALLATVNQKIHMTRSFNIHVNCGVNITGDKNIVGSPAIRPLAASQQQQNARQQQAPFTSSNTPTAAVWSGTVPATHGLGKRKASEEPEAGPPARRVSPGTPASFASPSPR
ncbi:uncharacterized protein PV09_09351 [Verruconis gallopava]|uniref:Uncharacterized protein n=1 Tax=Verruconis gallopava TaxID=253628 RepID=A0A0D1X9P4_9PEZI|nr:uncharacterized protein PV09_09351 [Verruconis gallopava]KIV98905.1 hypothetical protein PV09_09351 [Verruconis gallopava]